MRGFYSRIFHQILESSIAEDYRVRHAFEDLLKVADEHGIVDSTRESLARKFNQPVEDLNHCIAALEAPDPRSRDPEEEGRRLVRLDAHRDWGWRVVNYAKYESQKTRHDRAEKTRERVRKWRQGKRNASEAPPLPPHTPLFPSTDTNTDTDRSVTKRNGALQRVTEQNSKKQRGQANQLEAKSTWELTQLQKAIEEEIAVIRNRGLEDAGTFIPHDRDREQYSELRQSMFRIRKALASKATE